MYAINVVTCYKIGGPQYVRRANSAGRIFFSRGGAHYLYVKWPHFVMTNVEHDSNIAGNQNA
jgi:hypothetical protein